MADKGTDSRLKLTITEVGARQSVGDKGAVKLLFYAREKEAEKALPYFTFSSRLFETIEQGKGKEIDCEVNVSTREWERDGDIQHFTDRKVTQIYVDGLPIGGQKRQWNQDSPETRASIEAQKRADITAQLWMADKFNEKTPEVIKMRKWLMGGDIPTKTPGPCLNQPPRPKTEKKAEPADSPFPTETPPDAPTATETTPAKETATEEPGATETLLSQIAEAKSFKSTKTARSYLVSSLKIEDSRIDSEPDKVWEEIKEYFA